MWYMRLHLRVYGAHNDHEDDEDEDDDDVDDDGSQRDTLKIVFCGSAYM